MSQLCELFDCLLLDLDGTVWEGGEGLPHAAESILNSGLKAMYITNNASRASADVAELLQALDLPATDADVITSAEAAVEMALLEVEAGARALVLGSDSFKDLARTSGFEVVDSADDNPAVVFHGHSPETGWPQLSEAALSIRRGAKYFASNLDSSLPSPCGLLVGNGSMVAAVSSATGVTPQSAGKPEPAMFHVASEKCMAQRPLAVGDRLNTDIEGGNRASIPTLHVMTGVSREFELMGAPTVQRPTYLAADMRGLFDAPETLRPGAQGGFTATLDTEAGTVALHGGEGASTSMEALRTVLDKVWELAPREWKLEVEGEHAKRATKNWS